MSLLPFKKQYVPSHLTNLHETFRRIIDEQLGLNSTHPPGNHPAPSESHLSGRDAAEGGDARGDSGSAGPPRVSDHCFCHQGVEEVSRTLERCEQAAVGLRLLANQLDLLVSSLRGVPVLTERDDERN